MKGLLLKSWKNIRPQLAYYLLFLAIGLVVSVLSESSLYFCCIGTIFVFSVTLSAMAYDERDGWDKFAVASGVRRGELALSRYAFGLLAMLSQWAMDAILSALLPDRARQFALLVLFCGISLLILALLLPLANKFGVERTRILSVTIAVALFGGGLAFGGFVLLGESAPDPFPLFAVPCAVLALGALCLAVSCPLCVRICRRKDF